MAIPREDFLNEASGSIFITPAQKGENTLCIGLEQEGLQIICSSAGAAVARKDVAVASFLLKHNADVFMADDNGMTALHVAVAQGSVDLAEMILMKRCARTGGLLHREEAFGRTVVHLCAISGNVEVLQTLIRLGSSVSSEGDLDLFKRDFVI